MEVRLIRHGQTQGYSADLGLTMLGRSQSIAKGRDLSGPDRPGRPVRILHAPTARAAETAHGVREGLAQASAAGALDVRGPVVDRVFRNFELWIEGVGWEPTAAFPRYTEALQSCEGSDPGTWPGWLVEVDRFWSIQADGGDPITYWLTNPLQWFEPAALVVRRFWAGIVAVARSGPAEQCVLVCTHSGPIRAVAAAAVGQDPGEPEHVEDVHIRLSPTLERATVAYRGIVEEVEVPVGGVPWAPGDTSGLGFTGGAKSGSA